jgi:hypothetical protein
MMHGLIRLPGQEAAGPDRAANGILSAGMCTRIVGMDVEAVRVAMAESMQALLRYSTSTPLLHKEPRRDERHLGPSEQCQFLEWGDDGAW